jgi:hypothetical protein
MCCDRERRRKYRGASTPSGANRLRRLGRAVFLYGFAKNERDNIGPDDLAALKKLAAVYLGATTAALEAWCGAGELREVMCDGEEVPEPDR